MRSQIHESGGGCTRYRCLRSRRAGGQAQRLQFLRREQPAAARGNVAENHTANSHPLELFHFVAHLVHHQANLTFDPLVQHQSQAPPAHQLDALHLRASADDVEPLEQLCAVRRVKRLVQHHFVLLGHFVLRVREGQGKVAVVGKDEEPLTLHVEPTHVEDARPIWR